MKLVMTRFIVWLHSCSVTFDCSTYFYEVIFVHDSLGIERWG